jgi:imidazoleglycerol phosphate dehydratase HisB
MASTITGILKSTGIRSIGRILHGGIQKIHIHIHRLLEDLQTEIGGGTGIENNLGSLRAIRRMGSSCL